MNTITSPDRGMLFLTRPSMLKPRTQLGPNFRKHFANSDSDVALYFSIKGGRAPPAVFTAAVTPALVLPVALGQKDPACEFGFRQSPYFAIPGGRTSIHLCEFRFCRGRVLCNLGRPRFNKLCECAFRHSPVLCSLRRPKNTNRLSGCSTGYRGTVLCKIGRPSFTNRLRACCNAGVCSTMALVEALFVRFLLHREEAPYRRPAGSAAPAVWVRTQWAPAPRVKPTRSHRQ